MQKKSNGTPFSKNAKFIETDATIMRYDERSIADPLIGSVHDPIYQGAGAYGVAGVPQVKEGAVSKAHGGVLFIDEIGELQTCQINKLLKVLEDRKVMFESAYYSEENKKSQRIYTMYSKTAYLQISDLSVQQPENRKKFPRLFVQDVSKFILTLDKGII